MKLSKAIEGYWLDKKLNFSKRTVTTYTLFFRYLIDYLGDVEIETVVTSDIKRFLIHLSEDKELSKRSVHTAWIILSSLWTWGETELQLSHVIRERIPQPKYTKKVIKTFTREEIKKLIEGAAFSSEWKTTKRKKVRSRRPTALRDIAIIYTLLDSGIRSQELCDLTIAQYDQSIGKLFIEHGKGDKQRFVMLGNRARKALWKYLATRQDTKLSDPLFATRSNNHLQRDNLRHTLNAIAILSGVSNVHPHKFRHTFAINFLRNGGNILLLQAILGHSSLEMVKHYARIAEIDLETAVNQSVADNWRL